MKGFVSALAKSTGDTHNSKYPCVSRGSLQDVFMEDLLKDPVAELQRLYTNWGLGKMSPEYIARVESWKASKHQRSSFAYPTEQMGAIMEVMPFISPYFQRFPRASKKNV